MLPAPVAHDHEWLKIVASTVAGLFAGLAADPIRGMIQWHINVLRMQKAIGLDFAKLYMGLEAVKATSVPDWKFWMGVEMPVYDYYWEKNRELFYGSLELHTLHLNCLIIARLKTLVAGKQVSFEDAESKLRSVLLEIMQVKRPKRWYQRLSRWTMLRTLR